MRRFQIVIWLLFLITGNALFAQTYQSGESIISNGVIKATSTNFQTDAMIGQSSLGVANSSEFGMISGYIPYYLSAKFYDVSIANLTLDPATTSAGNTVSVSFDIINNESGEIFANNLEAGIYLSTDEVIDEDEAIGIRIATNIIEGNSTYSYPQAGDDNTIDIPLSTTSGRYFIVVSLDHANVIPETDETNNILSAEITISDDGTPPVIQSVVKDNYFTNNSSASVAANDNIGVDHVNFYHRGIRSSKSAGWGTPINVPLVSGVYTVTLESSWLDELGVEFWFEAFDEANNRDSTEVQYTFYQTAGNELTFPSIPAGRDQTNYKIISMPFDLSQKNASTIFSKLGSYDPKKWRMYHYLNGSTKEYNQGWSTIEPGKSYWILHDVTDAGQTLIGEGESVQGSKESPYTINLIQGWNQIGNPYRFQVTWDDVLAANGNPNEVERYRVWNNGTFVDGSNLASFGGGFVFTTAPVNLEIPVTTITSGRISDVPFSDNPLDSSNWIVNLQLTNGDLSFNIGGFGMHQDARIGKDFYDDVAMPRLPEYIDMNFMHPEYFIPRFNKDVVPTAENHSWKFSINKNSNEPVTLLSWDNRLFGDNDKALYLIDIKRNSPINMREYNSYKVNMESQRDFKIVFGDEHYIEEILVPEQVAIGQNYPNPFTSRTTIPIGLPDNQTNYNVEVVVINNMGQHVKKIFNGDLKSGYHFLEWDRTNNVGGSVKNGVYFYQLRLNTGEEVIHLTKHCIIQ